jgi:pimeloyl-ACP methyl ester carboxylesterase
VALSDALRRNSRMDCQLKDITVHYEMLGEGRPIILLHGTGVDHTYMVSDMEPLFKKRDGWERIYPDLPGHGKTPGMDWITNQDKMLEVVLEFVDKVIPGKRFVLTGSSKGAYLARGVVHHRFESIDGLLLTVPVIIADGEKRDMPSHVTLVTDPALVSELEPEEVEGFFQMAVVQSRKVLEYVRTNLSTPGELFDEPFVGKIVDHPENNNFSFAVDTLPKPFPAPTLIVAGRQDSVAGYRDAWKILDNYPRGTFVVLDRSGHFLGIEQEDLFHALVGEWLDRVEEYAGGLR